MNPPLPKKHRGGSPTKWKRNVKKAGEKRRLAEKWKHKNMSNDTTKKEEKTSFGEGVLIAVLVIVLGVGLFTVVGKVYDFATWAVKLEDRISCLEKKDMCFYYNHFKL